MGLVPPRIEPPKTIIGVGMRELLVLGAGLMLSILVVLSGLALALKVGLAALFVGLAALLALGRAPATGKTFEEYFLDIYHFHKRDRFLQRGVANLTGEPFALQPTFVAEPAAGYAPRDLIRIRPLPLSLNAFFSVLSVCFLAMLVVWLFFGGLQEFLLRFGIQ
jgi:hypothetical protein